MKLLFAFASMGAALALVSSNRVYYNDAKENQRPDEIEDFKYEPGACISAATGLFQEKGKFVKAFYGSLPAVDWDYIKCARYCKDWRDEMDNEGCVGFDSCQ